MKHALLLSIFLISPIANATVYLHSYVTVKGPQNSVIPCDQLEKQQNQLDRLVKDRNDLQNRKKIAFDNNDNEEFKRVAAQLDVVTTQIKQKQLKVDSMAQTPVNFYAGIPFSGLPLFVKGQSKSYYLAPTETFSRWDIPEIRDVKSRLMATIMRVLDDSGRIALIESNNLIIDSRELESNLVADVQFRMNTAQFCSVDVNRSGELLSFQSVYTVGEEKLIITNHLGPDLNWVMADTAKEQEYAQDTYLDNLIKDLMVEIFGDSELFMVDDTLLQPLTRGNSRAFTTRYETRVDKTQFPSTKKIQIDRYFSSTPKTLREALAAAKTALQQSGIQTNRDITKLMETPGRYQVSAGGKVSLRLKNVTIIFVQDSKGLTIDEVSVDNKEVFRTVSHSVEIESLYIERPKPREETITIGPKRQTDGPPGRYNPPYPFPPPVTGP